MFKSLIFLSCAWLVFFSTAAFSENTASAADTFQSQQSNRPEVGKITPEEEKTVERRIIARNYMALGLGPAGLSGLSSNNLDYLFLYAYYWEVAPWAAIKFKSDNVFDFSKSSFFLSTAIGSNFFLTATNISPFAGVEFGVGLAKKPHFDAAFGFVIGGSVGVAFFRTSSAQLLLDLNVQTLLKKVDNENPDKYSLGISVLF